MCNNVTTVNSNRDKHFKILCALGVWQSIDMAPKGGGAELITDPNWVEPPLILLFFADGNQVVCHWDWYYAPGGKGYRCGISAWIEPVSGEQIALHYGEPTHWSPLFAAPEST